MIKKFNNFNLIREEREEREELIVPDEANVIEIEINQRELRTLKREPALKDLISNSKIQLYGTSIHLDRTDTETIDILNIYLPTLKGKF